MKRPAEEIGRLINELKQHGPHTLNHSESQFRKLLTEDPESPCSLWIYFDFVSRRTVLKLTSWKRTI
jgi:hypothetical protein